MKSIGFIIVLVFCTVYGEEARLLASKFMLSNYAVTEKEFIIEYNIYNVGERPALKVQLIDDSFPKEYFETIRGHSRVKWDRIAPGANVSHAVVLKPLNWGVFNITAAEISYLPNEEATEPRKGYTTQGNSEVYIYSLRDYERKFSPHIVDWGLFTLMCLPSLAMPFLLWYKKKSTYEALAAQSKKKEN